MLSVDRDCNERKTHELQSEVERSRLRIESLQKHIDTLKFSHLSVHQAVHENHSIGNHTGNIAMAGSSVGTRSSPMDAG